MGDDCKDARWVATGGSSSSRSAAEAGGGTSEEAMHGGEQGKMTQEEEEEAQGEKLLRGSVRRPPMPCHAMRQPREQHH